MQSVLVSKFLRSKLFIICLAVIFVVIAIGLGRELLRAHSIGAQISSLEKQAKELEGRNVELGGIGEKLKDPEFLESEARTRFGLRKPGENVVIVRVSPSTDDRPQTVLERLSNARAWWLYFFYHEAYQNL